MPTCTKPDGTLVECTGTCRLPWGCPAEEVYEPARAEYVARSRATIQGRIRASLARSVQCRCGMASERDCRPERPHGCILTPELGCHGPAPEPSVMSADDLRAFRGI